MSLREFLNGIEAVRIEREADPYLEIARILDENNGRVVIFEKVKNSEFGVVGGVCSFRGNFARAMGVGERELLKTISDAINEPTEPDMVKKGACQEIVEKDVGLSKLPILTHTSGDMGPYITSGVFIASDPEYGTNASFHRASPVSRNKLVARVCHRNLYSYIERAKGELDIAICIGVDPSVLLSAAISADISTNELAIANSLKKLELVRCKTNDLMVPADSEIVLEGRITKERYEEGPFPDVTRTYDTIRDEPVIEINCITHRKNPIYQALLPASPEHELLMGMPREPVIFNAVNEVCRCKNVLLTPGGCSWLHGVVQIEKIKPDDGKSAIYAALKAHPSMKHVVVVDDDIDIHNEEEVEWAIATRFQAGDGIVQRREKGSSLDPSADDDGVTCKLGLDATIPPKKEKKKFEKISLGK
jgi:2,5-furandicarboxylate decarboxylase 1